MKITHCKLSKKSQLELLEFFIAEVTVRTASGLLGIKANTTVLYYHKIQLIIEYHLLSKANEIFDGQIELAESMLL